MFETPLGFGLGLGKGYSEGEGETFLAGVTVAGGVADVVVESEGERAREGVSVSDETAGMGDAGVTGGAVDAGEAVDKRLFVGLRRW